MTIFAGKHFNPTNGLSTGRGEQNARRLVDQRWEGQSWQVGVL
jgi:hypothetical protein